MQKDKVNGIAISTISAFMKISTKRQPELLTTNIDKGSKK